MDVSHSWHLTTGLVTSSNKNLFSAPPTVQSPWLGATHFHVGIPGCGPLFHLWLHHLPGLRPLHPGSTIGKKSYMPPAVLTAGGVGNYSHFSGIDLACGKGEHTFEGSTGFPSLASTEEVL